MSLASAAIASRSGPTIENCSISPREPPIGEGDEAKASTPGICASSAWIFFTNSCCEMLRSSRGTMVTKAMPELTWPVPPKPMPMNADFTSGCARTVRSISATRSSIAVRLVPSGARKFTMKRPSSSSGMKSLPTREKKNPLERTTASVATSTLPRCARIQPSARR